MSELTSKSCKPCEGGVRPLSADEAHALVKQAPGWSLNATSTEIERTFEFKNFYQTMAFANAVAWVANREDHHPDLEISYRRCRIRYSTHAIGGLSENDLICAAKINALSTT
ncbi:MAG: 4a-hydroxytetrahydrobiopterin dehydratase [Acidiferrobacteraceae bacterium]